MFSHIIVLLKGSIPPTIGGGPDIPGGIPDVGGVCCGGAGAEGTGAGANGAVPPFKLLTGSAMLFLRPISNAERENDLECET